VSFPYRFRPEIEDDLLEAYNWYENKERNLGNYFLDTFYSQVAQSAPYPNAYRIIYGGFRRILLTPFPYSAYFTLDQDEMVFVLVISGSRNPKLIRGMLRKRKTQNG
jgi:hypothetical protein